MPFTFCTSGAAVRKAGANVNSDIATSGAALVEWSNNAESFINAATNTDWLSGANSSYDNLSSTKKRILDDTCSSLMAIDLINFDMSGYTSRLESGTMLDVLNDRVKSNIRILKDNPTKTFVERA